MKMSDLHRTRWKSPLPAPPPAPGNPLRPAMQKRAGTHTSKPFPACCAHVYLLRSSVYPRIPHVSDLHSPHRTSASSPEPAHSITLTSCCQTPVNARRSGGKAATVAYLERAWSTLSSSLSMPKRRSDGHLVTQGIACCLLVTAKYTSQKFMPHDETVAADECVNM